MTMQFRTWYQHFTWLKHRGLAPATVIDIGVATDTNELYMHFPNSEYIFVEPCSEFNNHIEQLCKSYNGTFFPVACGSTEGELTLNVTVDLGGTSRYLVQAADDPEFHRQVGKSPVLPRTVPMRTLDNMVAESGRPGPYLIKVDVQGGELEVMRGATATLKQTDIVLLELNITEMFAEQPIFADVITFMAEQGFHVIDFINAGYNDKGILIEVDAVFARRPGAFFGSGRELVDIHNASTWTDYKGVSRKD